MERRRAAGALLALAACILCTAAAPTASNHTALNLYDGEPEGCYYNFQHYGEGDRIMTNEPCLNCTCHNRMLMCYLRVCPFTKPIGQDCTVEKRADQCCPIVTCPDVPVDLLTLTSTTSPAEYGATGIGKLDKYGCSINGKYFPEGSKVPPTPNKPCEHCYCIRNMTTCVMQECTLHVDGCTPIYHKDVCCPVRYSCDHPEDEILLLDDKTTTVRPTPGFLLTTTTNSPVTQFTQDCVHDDQIFADGALIKTEKACEHCYCMKGDIVCVVQECGTPMENEGKNCTSLPPREGQCCPDTYICEGDEINTEYSTDLTTEPLTEDFTTLSPPRRVSEGSGYRKEPDDIADEEQHPTETTHEGSGDAHETDHTELSDVSTTEDNTKYIYSTVSSIETSEKQDSEQDISPKPSDEISTVSDLEDHLKATTITQIQQEVTLNENAEPGRGESSTSSIPSYDHILETSQPEEHAVTEKEQLDFSDDKVTLTTISSILEEKEATTASKPYEESIVTDAFIIQHDKHVSTTSLHPILEDEGITTESDREQQTIPSVTFEENDHEHGLHTASTTSAPFLEEVEGIPTGTYEQHMVTDEITQNDIEDVTKDKADVITTPAYEDSDNLIDKHEDHSIATETTVIPKLEIHDEFAHATTNVPNIEEVEKTSMKVPDDLITDKPSEEAHVEDKLVSASTNQPFTNENEEAITETLKEHLATTQIQESPESEKSEIETDKTQTDKYEHATDEKTYDGQVEIPTTASAPFIDQHVESTKASEEPESVTSEAIGSGITDELDTTVTNTPIYHDYLTTMEDKDVVETQEKDTDSATKPTYIVDDEKTTSQDVTTEKHSEQDMYEMQKPVPTSAPVSEEAEIATTEFVKDQDFVTTGVIEQDSLKPGEYLPSTSSTPFLEEIEKLTTEISQGHVVTDVITEKEDFKPPKQVTSITESPSALDIDDISTVEPDRGLNTIPSGIVEAEESSKASESTTEINDLQNKDVPYPHEESSDKQHQIDDVITTIASSLPEDSIVKDDKAISTTEPSSRKEDEHHVDIVIPKEPELVTEVESYPTTESFDLQETKSPSQSSHVETTEMHENIPYQEATTETQTVDNTPKKEEKPNSVEAVVSTTQITPNLPEVSTINLGENEIDEDNLLPPGRIPGEGDCLLNGVTYKNESSVPSTNKCHSDCKCISSIVKCSPIICSAPPEYIENCQPIYDSPDACCPTYVCDQFRETLPPMPHVHIPTTELPQQSSIECRGDQCEVHEDKIHPVTSPELCVDKDCGNEADKKTDITSCGPNGCECTNGDCRHPPDSIPIQTQCESGNCEPTSVNPPQVPECNNGVCKDKEVPELVPRPCANEGDCEGGDENVIKDCADESCRRKETPEIETKPSTCAGKDCDKQTPVQEQIETSTLGDAVDIDTKSPELHHVSSSIPTEEQTIAPEKHEIATETNDYGTTISIEKTQATVPTTEIDSHKEPMSPEIQDGTTLPEFVTTEKEFQTDTYTKSPQLTTDNTHLQTKIPEVYITESDKDILQTKIPEDYVTESDKDILQTKTPEQYPTESDKDILQTKIPEQYVTVSDKEILQTKIPEEYITQNQEVNTQPSKHEDQPTPETSEAIHDAHTEPTKYIPDTEENTIKVITDEEIPTKSPVMVETNEILATTSEPNIQEMEKFTTQIPIHGISEVTESQIIDLEGGTTLSEMSIVNVHEIQTQGPVSDVSKSEEVTPQVTEETAQKVTTEYQSEPKVTTLSPTDSYVTPGESDDKVTNLEKGDDGKSTQVQTATESQEVSSESSKQENTESHLSHVDTEEQHSLPTESSEATTEHDFIGTDKITHEPEENLIIPETDKTQAPEKQYDVGTELSDAVVTEAVESTPKPLNKEYEEHTEHVLDISTHPIESASEMQTEIDVASTPSPVVYKDETTIVAIPDQDKTEITPVAPHKTEEEIMAVTSSHDISPEQTEIPATTDSGRITEKQQGVEQETVQTEKSETTPSYTELDVMEHVTIPERSSEIPEILSHKKEPSFEIPEVTESATEKASGVEETVKQEEPATVKPVSSITASPESQTMKSETGTEAHQPTVIKDETTDTVIVEEKTEKPILVSPTEDTYVSDLDKSTEHVQDVHVTELPETHETELFIPVKTEATSIVTPTEKETASDFPEIISVTEKDGDVDVSVDREVSTDKAISEYTTSQSYVPGSQGPETIYTEKAPSEPSDSTMYPLESITTEPSHVLIDTSTLAAPDTHEIHTESVPTIEKEEIQTKSPEIQVTTEISAMDTSKDKEVSTELSVEQNIEKDFVTKIQDEVTEHQEITTNVPEIHISTSSDHPPGAVTEPQDTNEVTDKAQVTEYQTPAAEFEYSRTTEKTEIEEPVKPLEDQLSTGAPKAPTEVPTVPGEHTTSSDLQITVGESESTDREQVTFSSNAPEVTDIVSDTVTELAPPNTIASESTATKSEESSTSLPHGDGTQHETAQTVSISEEPTEESSQIPDLEKVEHEEPITKTPEPIASVDDSTPWNDSQTVPQEINTEAGQGMEISTESPLEIASESHDKSELPEPITVPDYNIVETTPYLVELQEHTHKTIQEVTTSSPMEKEIITEHTISDAGSEHAVTDITTEDYSDKQTEIQEPIKHYDESVTLLDTPEKSTETTHLKDEQPIPTTQSTEIDIKETTPYKDNVVTTLLPTESIEIEKGATPEAVVTDNIEKTVTTSEKPVQSDLTVDITTPEEINVSATEKTTVKAEEPPTQSPVAVEKVTKPEGKPELPTPLPDLLKPGPSDTQPTDEVPLPDEETHFPSSGSSGYGGDTDYVEEDQAFGPGTCRYGGKVYVSAQQIPRDDPCDFCFCFRSDIICLQQSCPPPIHGCHEEPIQGFCCPRYECPVSMATTLNVTTTTTTTTTTLPPHFPTHSYKGAAQRRGCQIKGHTYKVGEVVRSSSGPCLHCTCGGDGQMKCDPKACTPEPMLRQMIAAAVSAKRRR